MRLTSNISPFGRLMVPMFVRGTRLVRPARIWRLTCLIRLARWVLARCAGWRNGMKLGFFTMPVHPLGRNYAQTLREDRQAFILADQLGFSEGYCGEHLTDEVENIPNSLMFIATLLDATKHMNCLLYTSPS